MCVMLCDAIIVLYVLVGMPCVYPLLNVSLALIDVVVAQDEKKRQNCNKLKETRRRIKKKKCS